MRMRDRPLYCIVFWQKGMRLCWMEKTDCLLKSLTCRSPHSPSSFLTNTLTHPIFTQTCRLFKVPAVKKCVVAHWKHIYLFRHWKYCYSMLPFLFLEGAFFDFCWSRCINQGLFWLKGEELEGKPSTACESLGPLFSLTRLWSVKRASAVGLQGGEGLWTDLQTEDPEREGRKSAQRVGVRASKRRMRFQSVKRLTRTILLWFEMEQENRTLASSCLWLISFSHSQTSSINMSASHWCLWDTVVCCSQAGSKSVPVTPSCSL